MKYLGCSNYVYYGLDVVKAFIEQGTAKYGASNIIFMERNFFIDDIDDIDFDYAICSQTFNNPYTEKEDNLDIIFEAVSNLYKKCKKGVSFNFVTDKVQYKNNGVAYHSPEKIMSFAYSLTHSVIMDNSCMPYECTCTLLKDTASDKMVFDMFKENHSKEFKDKMFLITQK